ncbi:MAG: TrkA C-terminal domain-containing protein [Candidatus Hydrothermia bacterium]|nr:TrkA C-terminal domain-containing protein [Candidatus Hydrothermia bacterium]
MKIKTIDIPSIGKRYDITTESNSKFVLIDYFSGFKEIYILKDNQTIGPIKLNSDEANQLAILLSRVLKEFLEKRIDVIFQNLAIETIKIEEDFKSINKTIEELKFRTITQTYIIAIIRDEKPIVMPKPEEKILENDVLVLLGSIEDIEKAKIYLKNLRA